MTRVAFIGLGTMGLPMARKLLAAGYDVVGCDLDPARAQALGAPTASAADAVAEADVALTSLPSPRAVEEIVLGADGVRAVARPGLLFADLSTGPPALARRLASELAASGVDALDAPVSGGPRGAEAATLTIMCGGEEAAFERARPVLERLGKLVVRVGASGAGQATKLCNNLLVAVTMAALVEACAVAEREGLAAEALYEILCASTGDSRVLRNRFPLAGADAAHPSSNGFAALFALDLIVKDLTLAGELARDHGVEPALAALALDQYRSAQERGLGALDYSALYLWKQEV